MTAAEADAIDAEASAHDTVRELCRRLTGLVA